MPPRKPSRGFLTTKTILSSAALLEKEKELTRLRDKVSSLRQSLPWKEISEAYEFEDKEGINISVIALDFIGIDREGSQTSFHPCKQFSKVHAEDFLDLDTRHSTLLASRPYVFYLKSTEISLRETLLTHEEK
jgi:hypothetical protein